MLGHEFRGIAVVCALLGIGAVFLLAGVLDAVMAHAYRAPTLVEIVARMADKFE